MLPQDSRIHFQADSDVTFGPAVARNVALARSRGSWAQTLDADDLLLPDGLATVLAAVKDEPDLHLTSSSITSSKDETNHAPRVGPAMKKPVIIPGHGSGSD
jgi:glycosyltransferase involved in cell wall biosynthesis